MISMFARAAVAALVAVSVAGVAATPAEAAAKKYSNCASLNKTYKHGVGRKSAKDKVPGHSKPVTNFKVSTAVYNANKKKLDRDKDGIACEKK
ncbi:excalibur calcium-binding domain-containing protein [Micromonosporaceae bacterium Da 78-11]